MEDFIIAKQEQFWFDKDQENRLFIKLPSGETIQQFSIEEVFTRKNTPPIILMASTCCGKSVLCCDVVKQCCKKDFNNVVYFTSDVVYSPENTYILQHVPRAFIQTKEIVQQLCKLLEILLTETRDDKQIQRINYLSEEEKQQFYQIEDQFFQKIKNSQYTFNFIEEQLFDGDNIPELQQLFQQDKLNDFLNFQNQNDNLFQQKLDKNSVIMIQGEQVSKQYVYNSWKQFLGKLQNDLLDQQVKYQQQVILNKLKDMTKEKKELFINQLINQKGELFDFYKACQQDRKSCIIMDDLTALFQKQSGTKANILYENEVLNQKDAFNKALSNIFNQGRHIGTILICLHSIQSINPANLQFMSIIILASNTQINNNKSTFLQNQKVDIQFLQSVIQQINAKNKSHYLLVCYKDESLSPDGKSKFGIIQADYQQFIQKDGAVKVNQELYINNPYFQKLCQMEQEDKEEDKEKSE